MIKTKAIRKIFTTTLSMFIILCVFSLMTINLDNTLKVNMEINDISGIGNGYVYLLSKNDYLVRKDIAVNSSGFVPKLEKGNQYFNAGVLYFNIDKIFQTLLFNNSSRTAFFFSKLSILSCSCFSKYFCLLSLYSPYSLRKSISILSNSLL